LNQTSTAGAYCCGTEDVMLDSLTDAARGVGTWSPEMNMVPESTLLTEGVYVAFVSSSGYTAGDLYYVPVKKTAHHRLSDGVVVRVRRRLGVLAERPLERQRRRGCIRARTAFRRHRAFHHGKWFLTLGVVKVPAQRRADVGVGASSTRGTSALITSSAPPLAHPPDTVADPVFVGAGSSAMETKGAYAWSYSVTFSVRMASATTFQWRADPLGETTGSWSGSAAIEVGTLRPLGDSGVFVAFASGETYGVGDEWHVRGVLEGRRY
jgi:hypothetical protein